MTRKALLTAVGDYQGFAQTLTAPVQELKRWQELLSRRPYQFDSITTLADAEATRDRVLAELRNLLAGAQPNDQLLWVCMCHGTVVRGTARDLADQALLFYPNGNRELQRAAVRESDIDRLLARVRPPRGVDITFVLDTCFAANYGSTTFFTALDGGTGDAPIPLFVPPPIDLRQNFKALNLIGTFGSTQHDESVEKPLVMAAAGKNESAFEVGDGRERRLIFSKRVLARLTQRHDTYRGIIAAINPLHPRLRQTATLTGNTLRRDERFPGEPDQEQTVSDQVTGQSVEAGLAYVDFLVQGLACFVNGNDQTPEFAARVILPYDGGEYVDINGPNHHFACIEIATTDITIAGIPPDRKYVRRGIEYQRWNLDAHTVAVQTADVALRFDREPPFEDHVPKITVICPEVRPRNPDPLCFSVLPFPGRFAAFLDITTGTARLGPIREEETTFARPSGTGPTHSYFTPFSATVTMPVISEQPTIVRRAFPFGEQEELATVRSGATVVLANAREIDLSGDGGGDVPVEQFLLYYKLATFLPPDAPLPLVSGIPTDDCTVTDWP